MFKQWLCHIVLLGFISGASASEHWFERFKRDASDDELYRFLYAMPKSTDLHNHLSGAAFSEWWWDLALNESLNGGYRYYTKVNINNCAYGQNQFSHRPYMLRFVNLQQSSYDKLSPCEKTEYLPLAELNDEQKNAWLDSIRLDKPHEGRDEFFQAHWQRLQDLYGNPYIMAEILVKNMQAFGDEKLHYIEFQTGVFGKKSPTGAIISPDDVADIYRKRLQQADARATGVTVRLQLAILRFTPFAEQSMRNAYQFVAANPDLFVGVNIVGREDNDKGYPLRFLPVLRELRRQKAVNLAFHGGEVDEPNAHVRDTLLLGAKRIGHGLNLITDPDTLLLMRNNDYLIEINLVSNKLLEYVSDYSQHPFPEYLRTGIPVALSTDDRGMWDSNLTDEYFTAVKEFNLTWDELHKMGNDGLTHSFLAPDDKKAELVRFNKAWSRFEKQVKRGPKAYAKSVEPVAYSYACKAFELCDY